MSNRFRIPSDIEVEIRGRDENCVYCDKPMIHPWQSSNRADSATIEHLREIKPFYWTDGKTGLKKEELAICCGKGVSQEKLKIGENYIGLPYVYKIAYQNKPTVVVLF